jgi:hypothetical protein
LRLGVHRLNESRYATGIGAAEHLCSVIFRGHQGQLHRLAARHLHAGDQARANAVNGAVAARHDQLLIER